jgi:hypothetical protein
MFRPQDQRGALANDAAVSHRVAGRHAWQDRSDRNTKVFDSIDFKIAINHGLAL